MNRLEGAGVLDPQPRQRIDVEEAPVIDVAGGEPPVAEPVVLALQQMVQRQRLRRPVRCGAIGGEAARDDLGATGNVPQFCLEAGRFLAVGMAQTLGA